MPRLDRPGLAALGRAATVVPSDCDVVVGLHAASLPSPQSLLIDWRRLQVLLASSEMTRSGAGPDLLHGFQATMDQPGQLPYELARRFGNWRVDYVVAGIRTEHENAIWLFLGGAFEPERLAFGLRAAGLPVAVGHDRTARGSVDAWRFVCSAESLEAWQGEIPENAGRGMRLDPRWMRAADTAAWLWVTPGSRVCRALGLGGAELKLEWSLTGRRLQARHEAPDERAAAGLAQRWRDWQARRALDTDWRNPNVMDVSWREIEDSPVGVRESAKRAVRWLRLVQRITCEIEGPRVRWELPLEDVSGSDVVSLLSLEPMHLLDYHKP